MRKEIFTVIFLIWATVSPISADGKCQLLSTRGDDDRSIVYSCIEVTFDHVKDISEHANWIEFSVSKLNIPEKAFARFSLHTLAFYKCDLIYIDPKAFEGLVDLQQLTFWESNIHVLTASWLRGLTSLTHLSLKDTGIVYIEPKTFLEVPNLQYLNIEDNNLNCLPEHALAPLRHLRKVRIGKNPWLCNCYAELVTWMLNRQIDFGTKNASKMKFECMSGWYATNNTKIREVFRNSTMAGSAALTTGASRDGSCMSKTLSVLSQTPDDVGSIKLSGVNIPIIPEFAFFQFGNSLRSLDMSNCSIGAIHSEAFAGLSKLEQLILFNNSITTVKGDWFRDLRGLRRLWLDRNKIKNIDSSVFLLLDKLEFLSLDQNGIECLSPNTFGLMKNLRRVNIAKNPWNCSCLNDFRTWLDSKQIAYHLSMGQCTNGNGQANGGQYGSGSWNNSFERNFTIQGTKLTSKNFSESHGTFTEFHYDFPTDFESYYQHSRVSGRMQDEHRRNGAAQQRLKRQNIGQQCQTSDPRNLLSNYKCGSACRRVGTQSARYFYECSGSTLSALDAVPDIAESITFEYSTIPVIPNYAFARFGNNLRILKLWTSRIETIEPQAFSGLVNLQELVISGNRIPEVRSSWFECMRKLRRLILTQNSITRIENAVFHLLPDLEQLIISDNQLTCIGIDSLDYMSRLRIMDIHKNPWSCLCRSKLVQWMNERNVNYNRDVLREYADWDCNEPAPHPGIPGSTIRPITNPWPIIRPETTDWPTVPPRTTARPTIPPRTTAWPTIPPPTSGQTVHLTPRPPQPPPPPPPPLQVVRPPLNGRCKMNPPNSSRCKCTGGDMFVLDEIPSDAERIEIINSTISELRADSFARFTNLKELLFYNCTIGKIDDSAFRGLHKLRLLVFQGSAISTIKSAWFRNLTALTELDLARNHVAEIEADLFECLPNLRKLHLQDNAIQCIYTNSLSAAKNLREIFLQNNPWKWRCLEELTQFLNGRNISYTNFHSYGGKRITCELSDPHAAEFKASGTTNTSISTVNVLCVSIAMLIFTKF